MSRLIIECPACEASYALPDFLSSTVQGQLLMCSECRGRWVGAGVEVPGSKLLRLDLTPYRERDQPPERPTLRVPMSEVEAEPERHSLRVEVTGGGLDRKGIFDLSESDFLIGRQRCHLNLGEASIPDRAIKISASDEGFKFEGLDGFNIPLGPISVPAGRIEPGAELTIVLPPYRVAIEQSTTPGIAIPDLIGATEIQSEPEPAPEAKPETKPFAAPQIRISGPDLSAMVASVAGAPEGPESAVQTTMRDLSAKGWAARSSGSNADWFEGLRVALVAQSGKIEGKPLHVSKGSSLVGRGADADLRVADDKVSSRHAQLEVLGPGHYLINDLASTNGTTVNGRTVSAAPLKHGDRIAFGGVEFRFFAKVKD